MKTFSYIILQGNGVQENYVLTREDIIEWERKNGEIPQGAIVLLRTGWDTKWPDRRAYLGLKGEEKEDEIKDPEAAGPGPQTVKSGDLGLNFPGFDASAARYLTSEKGVIGVGTDAISVDSGKNSRVNTEASAT